MAKIELTNREIEVIEKQLRYEIEVWSATDEEKEVLTSVIDKAEELMHELEAYDDCAEIGLVQWFYNKYKEQV